MAVNFVVLLGVFMLAACGGMQHQLVKCLHDIATKHFSPGRALVVSLSSDIINYREETNSLSCEETMNTVDVLLEEIHQSVSWHVLILSPFGELERRTEDKHESYIMFGQADGVVQEVKIQLSKLKTSSGWNPKAKFVIVVMVRDVNKSVCNATADDIFFELWKENIVNVIVILPGKHTHEADNRTRNSREFVPVLQVYTWFPYQPPDRCAKSTDPVLLDIWVANSEGDGRFVHNSYLFPQKVPNDLHGCPIRVSTFPFVTMVRNLIRNADGDISYEGGVEIRHFNMLMNAVNMIPVYLPPPSDGERWGTLVNGSWTGVIGHIIERKSDVAFGSMLNDNYQYSEGVDVADGYRWHVPCASPVPGWLSLTRVFYPSMWLVLILALVFVSLLVCCLVKTSGSPGALAYSNFTVSPLNLWAVILGVSAPNAVPHW
ncbi:uncharacterized protein LOC110832946 [Zootermopsis nevadensis]|nr:uncharacterized protein LOC110832946 [Zootermopsis nevadensis]